MAKLAAFIKKHWLAVVLCCVIAVLVISVIVPFIINESYKKGAGYITLWEAKDVFAFYGSYLSFLGSLSLGAVAVFQNKRANDLTTQMQKIEQARFVSMVDLTIPKLDVHEQSLDRIKNTKTPNAFVDEYINLAVDNPQIQRCFVLDAVVENKSEYPIVQISIHPGTRGNSTATLFGMENYKSIAVYIPANGTSKLRVSIPSGFLIAAKQTSLSLCIDFTNIFDYTTAARLDIENLGVSGKYLSIHYRLAKFVDVKPK